MSNNRFISASYQLFVTIDGEEVLQEETQVGRPFNFITGYGFTLPLYEQHLVELS